MTTVWAVYHEYAEASEEYTQWHEVLEALFSTEEEAKKYHDSMPPWTEDNHYTFGPRTVWDSVKERLND